MNELRHYLILKELPTNAIPSFASACWVTSLNYKPFNIPMEKSVIVIALSSKS